MYKNILAPLDIDMFALVSILIFTIFFAGLIIWVVRMDKNKVEKLAAMPIDQDETSIEEFPNI